MVRMMSNWILNMRNIMNNRQQSINLSSAYVYVSFEKRVEMTKQYMHTYMSNHCISYNNSKIV